MLVLPAIQPHHFTGIDKQHVPKHAQSVCIKIRPLIHAILVSVGMITYDFFFFLIELISKKYPKIINNILYNSL